MKDDVVQYLQAYWFHIRLVFKRSSGTQFLNSDPKVLFPVLRAYFSKLARERSDSSEISQYSECFFFRKYYSKVVKRFRFCAIGKVRNLMHFYFAYTDQSDPCVIS